MNLISRKTYHFLFLFIIIINFFLSALGCHHPNPWAVAEERVPRPAAWGPRPIKLPGVDNFRWVIPGRLCAGEVPENADGFRLVKSLGVKTAVSLRFFHDESAVAQEAGIDYISIPTRAWHIRENDILAFLRVATDPARQPVFVFCQAGGDRSSVMIAAYRVVIQGWTRQQAIDEMVRGGYKFHIIWGNMVGNALTLDADALRARLALERRVPDRTAFAP
jgi:protein tyrosine phosphatase (PTP) superfamily phosphohydrolase (DUF442 family)